MTKTAPISRDLAGLFADVKALLAFCESEPHRSDLGIDHLTWLISQGIDRYERQAEEAARSTA